MFFKVAHMQALQRTRIPKGTQDYTRGGNVRAASAGASNARGSQPRNFGRTAAPAVQRASKDARGTDLSLRPDDERVHVRVFLGKSTCCYINGRHKQDILVDRIFNYIFILDFQINALI